VHESRRCGARIRLVRSQFCERGGPGTTLAHSGGPRFGAATGSGKVEARLSALQIMAERRVTIPQVYGAALSAEPTRVSPLQEHAAALGVRRG
jgi:hypothetical protein